MSSKCLYLGWSQFPHESCKPYRATLLSFQDPVWYFYIVPNSSAPWSELYVLPCISIGMENKIKFHLECISQSSLVKQKQEVIALTYPVWLKVHSLSFKSQNRCWTGWVIRNPKKRTPEFQMLMKNLFLSLCVLPLPPYPLQIW